MDYRSANKRKILDTDAAKQYVGWVWSEKMDGWRVTYDPDAVVIRTKSGAVCRGAQPFADTLHSVGAPAVEGELYLGREHRAAVTTLCAAKRATKTEPQLWLFDITDSDARFAARSAELSKIEARLTAAGRGKRGKRPFIRAVKQEKIRSADHLRQVFRRVVAAGGEGVVVADPTAAYKRGRSDAKVKIKGRPDAEATVVGHSRGKQGRLVLQLKTGEGKKFKVFSGLKQSMTPADAPIGSVVTYEYENAPGGVPQQSRFVAVRPPEDMRAPKRPAPKRRAPRRRSPRQRASGRRHSTAGARRSPSRRRASPSRR